VATIKTEDFTGYSELSIDDAVTDALEKAGQFQRIEVIETRSSQHGENQSQYQVTLKARDD
jgi:dodecin